MAYPVFALQLLASELGDVQFEDLVTMRGTNSQANLKLGRDGGK